MGSLFAARFALAGISVSLFGRPSPHLTAIAAGGLELEELDAARRRASLPIVVDPAAVSDVDLALVMVKAWATSAALAPLRPFLARATTILTLQNGLGNREAVQRALTGHQVAVGVTSQGAVRPAAGVVRHTGDGVTLIGGEAGTVDDSLAQVAALFTTAGIPTVAVADIDHWIWRKLAVNSAINGPTALAGVPNGAIATDPRLRAAADILAGEVAAVARATGLDIERIEDLVAEIATTTATNRSSMLQDLEAGRRTEVAAIYDAVIQAGARAGIDTPANRVISALIHARDDQLKDVRA